MNMFFDLYLDEEKQCIIDALIVEGNLKKDKISFDSLYITIEAKNKKEKKIKKMKK